MGYTIEWCKNESYIYVCVYNIHEKYNNVMYSNKTLLKFMFSKINIMTSASFMLHLPDMTLSVSLFSTFLNLFVLGVSLESLDLLWEPIWKFFQSDKCGSHGGTPLIRSLTNTEPAARSEVSYLPWLPHLWDLLQHIPHCASMLLPANGQHSQHTSAQ